MKRRTPVKITSQVYALTSSELLQQIGSSPSYLKKPLEVDSLHALSSSLKRTSAKQFLSQWSPKEPWNSTKRSEQISRGFFSFLGASSLLQRRMKSIKTGTDRKS